MYAFKPFYHILAFVSLAVFANGVSSDFDHEENNIKGGNKNLSYRDVFDDNFSRDLSKTKEASQEGGSNVERRILQIKSTKAPTIKSTKAPTIKSTKAPTIKSTKAPTIKSTKAPTIKSFRASPLAVEDMMPTFMVSFALASADAPMLSALTLVEGESGNIIIVLPDSLQSVSSVNGVCTSSDCTCPPPDGTLLSEGGQETVTYPIDNAVDGQTTIMVCSPPPETTNLFDKSTPPAQPIGVLTITVLPVSASPTEIPSSGPSAAPSLSAEPSNSPSSTPSTMPSGSPSGKPSSFPSLRPSNVPSRAPSAQPSSIPSSVPSVSLLPTEAFTLSPTISTAPSLSSVPSLKPSLSPSGEPSSQPSKAPSDKPSDKPSTIPSSGPSAGPSSMPSSTPSLSSSPSAKPSSIPSLSSVPSSEPSSKPSLKPSAGPSDMPSVWVVPEGGFDNLDWADLPPRAKAAATTLGYDEDSWDSAQDLDIFCTFWSELTTAEQEAAQDLGYEDTWNDEVFEFCVEAFWYDDVELWDNLPVEIQTELAILGYNATFWDVGPEPAIVDYSWVDLTPAQKEAATNLGWGDDYEVFDWY